MSSRSNSLPILGEGSGISILLVEDESISRGFLSQVIQMRFPDVEIHTAENGKMGLDLFRKTRAKVVLTDISMPVMDGIRMAREIRLLNSDVNIFALTAFSSLKDMADDIETLFTDFIPKPVVAGQLWDVIGGCIDRSVAGPEKG
jgi:YesN/AraC family two-component response regulator